MATAARRGLAAVGVARTGADLDLDIADLTALREVMRLTRPRLVVNTAALTDLAACEDDPDLATWVNTKPVGVLVECCRELEARLVHISTDHYYTGNGAARHDENAPLQLVNEYARSKWAAERLALTLPGALVLRTNFTGWRGDSARPTWIEWLVRALERHLPMTLFDDYWTSTMDAQGLSTALFDLAERNASGILNVATRQPASKWAFAHEVAGQMGIALDWANRGSVAALAPRRAESLGLDVSKSEAILGYALPTLFEAVESLLKSRPIGHT